MTGRETLCDSQQNTGYSVNGGFAEYVLADPDFLGHLPDGLDFAPAAPILCAGVTVYKGLEETDTRPGQTVVVSGVGGLGHLGSSTPRPWACTSSPLTSPTASSPWRAASAPITRSTPRRPTLWPRCDACAAAPTACWSPPSRPRRSGRQSACSASAGRWRSRACRPSSFPLDIFDTVLCRKTIRGSIVNTRADLGEALQFAGEGKLAAHYATASLVEVNDILQRFQEGRIEGRVVMTM